LGIISARRATRKERKLCFDQWRICFIWREGAAERVEIVDYH
jgi:plasmid maintenance system killer protein